MERALDEPADLVAIAGGDGTFAAVVTQLAGKPVPAALLPVGSANNIARTLGIADTDLERLIATWNDARRQAYDLGEITTLERIARFVESAGGGLFAAALARDRARPASEDQDKVEHGLQLLRELVEDAPAYPWRVELDGVERSGEFLAVEATVVSETGPNLSLAPGADPGDGRLDVVAIPPDERPTLASYLDERLLGRAPRAPRFEVTRSTRVAMWPAADCPPRVDDDPWDRDGGGPDAALVSSGRLSVELLLPR